MNLHRVLMLCIICLALWECELEGILGSSSSGNGLSNTEIVEGLKTALKVGIDSSASRLGRENGYLLNELVKIPLPEDVSQALAQGVKIDALVKDANPLVQAAVKSAIVISGFNFNSFAQMKEELIIALNRTAESAAPQSVDIFVSAITDLSIANGLTILRGDSTAATSYLREKTFQPLRELYLPFVNSALDHVNANQLWEQFAVSYNQLIGLRASLLGIGQENGGAFFTKLNNIQLDSLTTDLSSYTTEKALSGLFFIIGEEEANIRSNPLARVSEILKKVFGTLDA